ncbi:hypothetical protein [Pseudovibrio sp. Tun.PSC04-5.I4]|nr:hypothetical protein [Pseudovibrio sp. Tun.PSC04-5.I4]SDR49113.1 hypothetical protein SAMN04515695_6126 [Pseudovibrio sp. Tun.PSC04-5.I4]
MIGLNFDTCRTIQWHEMAHATVIFWLEMARDGARWREMARDGVRWREMA